MITIHGKVGKSELREHKGRYCVSFSVAQDESYKDSNGQKVKKTLWGNCSQWLDKADSAKGLVSSLVPGQHVVVQGNVSVRAYEGGKGIGASLEVSVSRLDFAGGIPKSKQKGSMVYWLQAFTNDELDKVANFISELKAKNKSVEK